MDSCILVGQKRVWLFLSPNQEIAKEIASAILLGESIFPDIKLISGFIRGFVWEAVKCDSEDEEVKELLELTQHYKEEGMLLFDIEEIKPMACDVIYMTRSQKERWDKSAKN